MTHIGKYAFANCSIENVYVDNLLAFARIYFENECSNPMVHPTASLYAGGKLVEETVKVSFVLDDDWFAGFYDESAEWGYSTEMTIEKGVGRPVYPPEVIVFDGRFEVRSWDADLLCVMNDTEAHPVYGGAEINDAVYSFRPYDTEELRREWMAAQCSFESFVYDALLDAFERKGLWTRNLRHFAIWTVRVNTGLLMKDCMRICEFVLLVGMIRAIAFVRVMHKGLQRGADLIGRECCRLIRIRCDRLILRCVVHGIEVNISCVISEWMKLRCMGVNMPSLMKM